MRADREFSKLIRFIKGRCLLAGKKPPSTASITKVIARRTDREDLLKDVFIKF